MQCSRECNLRRILGLPGTNRLLSWEGNMSWINRDSSIDVLWRLIYPRFIRYNVHIYTWMARVLDRFLPLTDTSYCHMQSHRYHKRHVIQYVSHQLHTTDVKSLCSRPHRHASEDAKSSSLQIYTNLEATCRRKSIHLSKIGEGNDALRGHWCTR